MRINTKHNFQSAIMRDEQEKKGSQFCKLKVGTFTHGENGNISDVSLSEAPRMPWEFK